MRAGQGAAGRKTSLERTDPGSCRLPGQAWLLQGEGHHSSENPQLFLMALKPLPTRPPRLHRLTPTVLSPLLFGRPQALLAGSLHMQTLRRRLQLLLSGLPVRGRPRPPVPPPAALPSHLAPLADSDCPSCWPAPGLSHPQNTSSAKQGSLTAVWSHIPCTRQIQGSE